MCSMPTSHVVTKNRSCRHVRNTCDVLGRKGMEKGEGTSRSTRIVESRQELFMLSKKHACAKTYPPPPDTKAAVATFAYENGH